MPVTHADLHHAIINTIIERGWAPSIDELSTLLDADRQAVVVGLRALQDYHGVVLHPHNDEVWVAHPFSTVPTGFLVRARGKEWWGNCAWCSLGAAALTGPDVTITTVPGFDRSQVSLRIEGNTLLDTNYVVHFPTPMVRAWDNVVSTCTMMLLFDDEPAVDTWCAKHGKQKGDVRPINQIWEFAREWYGRHNDPDWKKWTPTEAADIFARHGLDGPIWELPLEGERF
ncbi:alkylmercury lyase family protein [Pseudovibrio exalbescens]|uniref:alkylmercury lyase family protein n=1 Tax=Pseudovibrio exalbescens TaxID=197461 RepID=UPI0023655DCA|nr:alkylmercury lyase family protein [Pseudovibrio exalbescens]MDD7908323.1 alkylmercury lyase family protein [Pseudovibrio exalbescens]